MSQQNSNLKLLKTYIYPAIFIIEKDGGYSVIFPDLLGCQTQGNSLAESLLMAKEALSLYIFDKLEDKKDLPKASNPKKIENKQENLILMVEVNYQNFKDILSKI